MCTERAALLIAESLSSGITCKLQILNLTNNMLSDNSGIAFANAL